MNPELFKNSPSGRVIKTLTGYFAFTPNPLPPALTWTPELVETLSNADRALGELAGLGNTLFNPHLLILPFSRREAVLSSQIEGTQSTLSDLYAYETEQLSLFTSPSDAREVHNYVKALEYGIQRLETLPVSLRLVREVHARLMQGVRGEHQTPGEFRRSPNWIGHTGATLNTASYVPPPVDEMKAALDAFEKYLHAKPEYPPLIRLGLIHYQFEAIHPFLDGNGRVGRLLIIFLMVAWKLLPAPLLYLSAYIAQNRQLYYDLLLQVSQQGVWETWLQFFLQGVASQSRDAVARAKQLQKLRETYRRSLQKGRSSAKLLQAIDLLFVRPILTVQQVEKELGVSFVTAGKYINRLQEENILREMTGQTRNRVFIADAILRTIDAPLSSGN